MWQLAQESDQMDLNMAITGRRAVREYTVQAVDERSIRALIDAAVQAPSAVNQQPWTFTVVREQSMLDQISREAKSHMLANSLRICNPITSGRGSPIRIFRSSITRRC